MIEKEKERGLRLIKGKKGKKGGLTSLMCKKKKRSAQKEEKGGLYSHTLEKKDRRFPSRGRTN